MPRIKFLGPNRISVELTTSVGSLYFERMTSEWISDHRTDFVSSQPGAIVITLASAQRMAHQTASAAAPSVLPELWQSASATLRLVRIAFRTCFCLVHKSSPST